MKNGNNQPTRPTEPDTGDENGQPLEETQV